MNLVVSMDLSLALKWVIQLVDLLGELKVALSVENLDNLLENHLVY